MFQTAIENRKDEFNSSIQEDRQILKCLSGKEELLSLDLSHRKTYDGEITTYIEEEDLSSPLSTIEGKKEDSFTVTIPPISPPSPPPPPLRKFKVLAQWEGVVTEMDEDFVYAELCSLAEKESEEEIASIPIEEFPKSDHSLLDIGQVFYWTIGYETASGGQVRRVSEIRVKRTPKWTQRMIDSAQKKAQELWNRLQHDDKDKPSSTR